MNVEKYLLNYQKYFQKEQETVKRVREFVQTEKQSIYDRKNMKGHITVSGVVINKGKILMIKHPVLNMILFPGGHVEKLETPVEAAIREVKEETGYSVTENKMNIKLDAPIHIDIHAIPQNIKKEEGAHIHYNFYYLLDFDERNIQTSNELAYQWYEMLETNNVILDIILNKLKEVRFNEYFGKK